MEHFENFNYDILDVLTFIRELEKTAPMPIIGPLNIDQMLYLPRKKPAKTTLKKLSYTPVLGDTVMADEDSDPEVQFLCGKASTSSSSTGASSEDEPDEEESKWDCEKNRNGEAGKEPDYRSSLPQWCKDAIVDDHEFEREDNEFDHRDDFMACSNEEVGPVFVRGYRNVRRYVKN